MEKIESAIKKVLHFLSYFSMCALAIMMAITVVNIILRKFFNTGITGVIEISQFCLVVLVWMCAGLCAYKNNMIEVDLLKFPKPYMMATRVITAVMCFIMSYANVLNSITSGKANLSTGTLHAPKAPFIFIIAVGFAVVGIEEVFKFILDIINYKKEPVSPELNNADQGEI